MALIIKEERQTVFDILLENAGAISGLFEFLKLNNLTELDIPSGEYLAPKIIKQPVVDYFKTQPAITTDVLVPVTPPGSFSNSFSNSFNN